MPRFSHIKVPGCSLCAVSLKFVAIGFAVLLLAGCSGAPSENSGPATPPADGGQYGSVVDLRDAFVAAGGSCDDWDQTNQVANAAESGSCSSTTVLSTYTSESSRDEVVAAVKEIGKVVGGSSQLVGVNWIVNSPDASDVRDKLGGTLVTG